MINITVKEFSETKKAIDYAFLQHSKPKNDYSGYEMDVSIMTYEEVKAVVRYLRRMNNWEVMKDVFETCFKIDEYIFWNGFVTDFFSARNYIIETFKNIIETENKLLKSISADSVLWEAAGGKRLNKFSDILPLNQLGKIYGIYPFELKDYKYYDILTLLRVEKEQGEVELEFNKLKRAK